jgi:putative hydroxymethylpyrimidine transport system permease protein
MIIIVLISLLVAWELLVSALNVAPYILPAPSELFVAMWEARSLWPKHIWMTLSEALIGLVISVVLAVGLSVTMLRSFTAHKVLYPLLIISQTIPLIAISPIFIIWFDYTIWSKVAVAILWSFFPIVISLNEGFRNVSLERREMMISLGATRWQMFRFLEWPSALPSFFAGLQMAAAYSVIGATVGEWLGAESGLGFFARRASNNMQTDLLFAAVVMLCVLGLVMVYAVKMLERVFIKHIHPSTSKGEKS